MCIHVSDGHMYVCAGVDGHMYVCAGVYTCVNTQKLDEGVWSSPQSLSIHSRWRLSWDLEFAFSSLGRKPANPNNPVFAPFRDGETVGTGLAW